MDKHCLNCLERFTPKHFNEDFCYKQECQEARKVKAAERNREWNRLNSRKRGNEKSAKNQQKATLPPRRSIQSCCKGQLLHWNRWHSPTCPYWLGFRGVIEGGKVRHNGNHIRGGVL